MSARHTDGPWSVTEKGNTFVILEPNGRDAVASVSFYDENPTANARLIAAAPELMAALVDAAEFIQPFNRAEDLLARIDAALAKAGAA